MVSIGEAESELVRAGRRAHRHRRRPGETARLSVTVGTDARADLAVEAHLISPWGTWEWMGPGGARRCCGPARPSTSASTWPRRPGDARQWWALVRIGCAGRLLYTPAVAVTVR